MTDEELAWIRAAAETLLWSNDAAAGAQMLRLIKEIERLNEEAALMTCVVAAARELVSWDWLRLLDDDECFDDVRRDLVNVEVALHALDADSRWTHDQEAGGAP